MRSTPPATQFPSIERQVIIRWEVFDFFEVYVHEHAKAQFTAQLFVSRMKLWALIVTGVCSASAVAAALMH
jgi:hypothetical protein